MVLQRRSFPFLVLLLTLAISLSACNLIPNLNFSLSGSSTSSLTNPSPNTWTTIAPGIEVRSEQWTSPGDNSDTVVITRVDPAHAQLQIGYQPTNPMTMSQWQKATGAKVLINGGYFDSNNQPEGLLVSNGQAYGTSYQGFGGMLSADNQGNISLRSLSEQPYDPNADQLAQATQSSPMLMIGGKRTQFDANAASQRRSIVATDTQGRLLFIASPSIAFSLDEIADLLASSDLSIKDALNLDGGASTGLYVSDGTHQKAAIDSATPLPIVIIVK